MAHELRELETWGKLTFYYALVGVLVSLAILLFFFALSFFSPFFLRYIGNLGAYEMPIPVNEREFFHFPSLLGEGAFSSPFLLIILALIPAFGGLVVGLLKFHFIKGERAWEFHETGVFIDAFHNRDADISAKEGIIRGLCSVLTISTGGSAGREGPSAMLGAAVGSVFGKLRRSLSVRERRRLVAAGAGAGIAAIFKSPLGGAFFGVETLYRRDMEVEALIPSVISAISAYIVSCTFLGFGHIYEMHFVVDSLFSPISLAFFLILGMLCVPLSYFFSKASSLAKQFFYERLKIVPDFVKPAIGGLIFGAVFLFFIFLIRICEDDDLDACIDFTSGVLGGGYGFLQEAFSGNLTIFVLCCVMIAKIIATSITLGSGGSGGSFVPSLTIGAALGGLVGNVLGMIFPDADPHVFALVGAAAFFAAAANAPFTSLFVVCEISGSYELFVPALLAIVPAYTLSGNITIYPEQTETRRESPAHRREFFVDLLEGIRVEDACTKQIVTIPESMRVEEALHFAEEHGHIVYPVVNERGRMVGIISIPDLELARERGDVNRTVGEICIKEVVVAYPDEFLEDALQRMDKFGVGRLPVVKCDQKQSTSSGAEEQKKDVVRGEAEILGIITRADIIREHCRRRSLIYRAP